MLGPTQENTNRQSSIQSAYFQFITLLTTIMKSFRIYNSLIIALVASLAGCATTHQPVVQTALKQQVVNTERAFAKTMADRNQAAFATFVSEEAIFFSGDDKQLHGKQEVINWWKDFFTKPEAPFSWEPETVEVLPSGTLALSTGPVHNAAGKLIGTFSSIWRLEAPNTWRIIFDKGNEVCN
jgi:ketosteroid isomerase-like protein